MENKIKLESIIKSEDENAIRNALRVFSFHEILELISRSKTEELELILKKLPLLQYVNILPYLTDEQLEFACEAKDTEFIAKAINHLDSDDAVNILRRIDGVHRAEVLEGLDQKADISRLLAYEPETSGGIMQAEVLKYPMGLSVRELIRDLKYKKVNIESFYKIYIVDKENFLKGEIPLSKLIYTDPDDLVDDLIEETNLTVSPHMDQEMVAKEMAKHDVMVLPVVSEQGKLLGRITFDDIQDVIESEAKEDIALYAGTFVGELDTQTSILKSAGFRLPWLLFGVLSSLASAKLIGMFEFFGSQSLVLVSLAPMIMTSSGNVGAQTSMINARELSNEKDPEFYRFLLKKEFGLSLVISLSLGIFAGLMCYLLYQNLVLVYCIFLGTVLSIVTCSAAGVILPNLFNKLNIDPALSTGPLMTPLCDVIALLSFFFGAYIFVQ